ncbi:hypothetical protein RhiJN_25243 [Ceratobasidium sp. AG-Ba]|nr:hypothetical protein RhiJN_25243 [Ceratobasidium sp. AG-Ba]
MDHLLVLLVSITLTAIFLAVPGFAPYFHAFVRYVPNPPNFFEYGLKLISPPSVAQYPAYGYYIWQYAPSVLRKLLLLDAIASRMARLSRVYRSALQNLAPRALPYTAFAFSRWVLRNIVAFTGLCAYNLAGSSIFADYWHK